MFENILKQDIYAVNKYGLRKTIEREMYARFDSNSKIVWVVWLRWVGKTSYLLSRRIKTPQSIYISCDSLDIKKENLFNLVDELQKNYGFITFFLDEIHFSEHWQQSLKNIYDFLDVKVIFSGSNMINITKWWYDLSRRIIKHKLTEFTFKEYVFLTKGIQIGNYSFSNILENHINIARENISWYSKKILEDYFKYWQFGYYYEDIGNVLEYKMKMENALKKSIYEDLSDFVDISTHNLSKIEDIIYYISNAGTSDISIHSISKNILLSPQTTEIYMEFLKNIGLINTILYFWKLTERLRKNKKFYISNTNTLSLFDSYIGNFRETFFVSQMKRLWKDIYFLSNTDFVIKHDEKNIFFEIGGKNKKRPEDSIFVIKDDIEIWKGKEIPLWLWGLVS